MQANGQAVGGLVFALVAIDRRGRDATKSLPLLLSAGPAEPEIACYVGGRPGACAGDPIRRLAGQQADPTKRLSRLVTDDGSDRFAVMGRIPIGSRTCCERARHDADEGHIYRVDEPEIALHVAASSPEDQCTSPVCAEQRLRVGRVELTRQQSRLPILPEPRSTARHLPWRPVLPPTSGECARLDGAPPDVCSSQSKMTAPSATTSTRRVACHVTPVLSCRLDDRRRAASTPKRRSTERPVLHQLDRGGIALDGPHVGGHCATDRCGSRRIARTQAARRRIAAGGARSPISVSTACLAIQVALQRAQLLRHQAGARLAGYTHRSS
jgi:hypothetical protein